MSGFRDDVRRALANPALQQALDRNAERRRAAWGPAFASLPDAASVRRQAAAVRNRTVDELPGQVETFVRRVEANGIAVHRAADAAEACRVIVGLLQARDARRVVKAKSMVTEEIRLNDALTAAGIEVVESDLGEFIVQLRGEPPAHITAPAIHLRREDVARTFEAHLGMPYTTEVEALTAAARRALRRRFLEAQAGISGVNFGVVDTGTLALVTNEGNGRMVTTLPRLHIAVMGIERIVPTLADLRLMLDILPRAGTGQRRTSYVTLLQGPRSAGDPDGASERHLVLVDNGRWAMRRSPLAESLACIRCGACLNACPVYQEIGGHAYGSIYPGPIGSVVSPGLWGTAGFGHLATASTLCGACRDACPVGIDLPTMLLRVRADRATAGRSPRWMRAAMHVIAYATASSQRLKMLSRLARTAIRLAPKRDGWIGRLPPPLDGWTRTRDFPPIARRTFRERWGESDHEQPALEGRFGGGWSPTPMTAAPPSSLDRRTKFILAAREAGYEVIECAGAALPEEVLRVLGAEGARRVLCWDDARTGWESLLEALRLRGVEVVSPVLDPTGADEARVIPYAEATAGLTAAVAGLADDGTIVLPSGRGRSQLASLLPPTHLAVLRQADLHDSLETWLPGDGARWIEGASSVVLITGPSRTADIELTLTVGVHGPGRVVLFLVADDVREAA